MRARGLSLFAFVLALLTAIPWKGYAQPARFKHYSTDEGFTGAAFKTMAQDSLGFLWISSGSGLYKFDGYNFVNYNPDPADSLSLPSELVRRIWIDPFGKLWAAFPRRISYYDRDLDGFISFKVPLETLPESMWFENQETVWLGTQKKGLIRFQITTGKVSTYMNETEDALFREKANTIREIKDDGKFLLLGTAAGLWKFDKEKKNFIRPPCASADSTLLYGGVVSRIFQHDTHCWLWIDQQLVRVDRNFSRTQSLDFRRLHEKFDTTKSQEDARVREIAEDAAGIFWIASQGLGLIRFNPADDQMVNYRNEIGNENSLPSDVLNHVIVDRYGNVWVTTVNKGIVQLKKQSLYFYNYLLGISTSKIVTIKSAGMNHILVGSQGSGLWMGSMQGKEMDALTFSKSRLLESKKGFENLVSIYRGKDYFWIGSLASGTLGLSIHPQTGLPDPEGMKVLYPDADNPNTLNSNFNSPYWEDGEGNLWVGTFEKGLNKVALSVPYGEPGSVVQYVHHDGDPKSLIDDGLRDIAPADSHSIWFTTERGLDLFKDGSFDHVLKGVSCTRIFKTSDNTLFIGSKNGLYEAVKTRDGYTFKKDSLIHDAFVISIQEDKLGRLWILSYEGLIFYDRKEKISLVFKKDDGLPSSRAISAGGSAQTAEGMMVFSNAEGLTLFDPLSLRINTSKPKPLLTQLKINNRIVQSSRHNSSAEDFTVAHNINTLDQLTLDHTQNILTLEFSAMDFTAPERNQYQYKLDGFDEEWIQTDWKNRTATYTNLRSGSYTFKVRASNRDGIWNDNITELKIRVLPPPWKTWWAYSLYGLTLAGILFFARRNLIQRERLASKLKMEHLELEKVQEIDKAKTNFFANISHEFRTPLTLIQGPVQNLLEKFKRDKETQYQLNLVQQNSDRLLRLVNQILELARLESGSLKNEYSEGDLIRFLKNVVDTFSALAVQKRISLIRQLPSKTVRAVFDRDKLEKIVSNLISNAIKFTPEHGAIIVNVTVMAESDGRSTLLFRITDTGKGIPAEQRDKIFERFYQVSEDGSPNAGTGIGLALSKELAEFLGGSLTLESTVGEGSKFMLKLPLTVLEIQEQPVEEVPNAEIWEAPPSENGHAMEGTEKPLLLIVEDHAELRKFIITCLGNDYQFIEAANGKEGLHLAIEQVPALILSDVMMPMMDGIEMCNKIKNDHRTSHIPLILLTAKAGDDSKLTGLGIGADDYLIKPFHKEELILKIRNQVAARVRLQEKIRLELLSTSTPVQAISADEKFLERIKSIVERRLSDEQLSVEALAEEIGLSRVQLYRKIMALTGISVNEFIRKLRLQKAAQLLQQQWGPVSQVAYEVGFSNLSYFSKCFKEQFGTLPSEYQSKS